MKGGMVDDALSEVEVAKAVTKRFGETKTEIKVRCPQCRELNGETAKFCSQCGTPV
jgi:phage FluMu protein Com